MAYIKRDKKASCGLSGEVQEVSECVERGRTRTFNSELSLDKKIDPVTGKEVLGKMD